MNILLLANHLNIGGITSYVLNLSYGLKKLRIKVSVGALPGWGEKLLKENGIPFLRLPLKTKSILSPRIIFSYFILKGFVKKESIQLIHAQTRITQFLAFLLSRRLNIPYVCTFHGFYRHHLMRRIIPCPGDLTIAISQAVGQHLIRDFNLNRENLRVIYNSVYPILSHDTHKNYAYLKGSPTLAIIARLSEEKGHILLFSVFRELVKEYPQSRLLVVGSGRKEEELKSWVSRENLTSQIIFLGNIPQLSPLFKIVDISVLPSTLEGLGISILEAQASGVPVVASSIGGIPEIIKHRDTGILVRPADFDELYHGIKLLLEDALLKQKIVDNAKQQIKQRFNLEKMATQVESVYKELVASRVERF
jgi:glycosyltransferase involved in cell wall biosynthesis